MKKVTKMMALVLVAVMMFAMGTSALAAENDTITITVNASGQSQVDQEGKYENYSAYQIFDVTKTGTATGNTSDDKLGAGSSTGYSYTIKSTDEWYSVVATGDAKDYFTLAETTTSGTYTVTVKDEYNNENGAKAIAAVFKDNISGKTAKNFGGGTEVPTLETAPGYYLIIGANTSSLILATTDITITEKAEYPTLTKTEDKQTLNIGDTVTYTLTIHVPSTAVVGGYMYVSDTLDSYLNADLTSLKISSGSLEMLDETADANYLDSDATWQRKFAVTADMLNKDVTITYSAELLDEAAADTAYPNTAYLDYYNYTTPESTVYVTTFDFDVTKNFTGSNENDEYTATFQLHKGSESGDVISFVADGNNYTKPDNTNTAETTNSITLKNGVAANILGLDDGTYYLVETSTQNGYNLLNDPVVVKITKGTADADGKIESHTVTVETGSDSLSSLNNSKVEIQNNTGTELPSTGGIGTTIFYVLGAILVIGAGVILVTRRRMSNAK